MRKTISIFILYLSICHIAMAQTPKWTNKVQKAIFSVITYDTDNNILNTGNGFFINEKGDALSDYTLFKGAQHAVIINSDGKQMPVNSILGANEMYDVIKFNVNIDNEKIINLTLADKSSATEDKVWLLPYSTQKNTVYQQGVIEDIVTIAETYQYYTLRLPITEKAISCPITNQAGEVIGMIQQPTSSGENKISYAIDAKYAADQNIGALTVNSPALRAIGIKKALPANEEEALVYLYMRAAQKDKDAYLETLNDFIKTYPQNSEGYTRRAALYIESFKDETHFQLAEQDLATALSISSKKDEVHYTLCKIIYTNEISTERVKYKDWSIKKALGAVQQAIAIDSLPLYLQTEGELHFILKNYNEAYKAYQAVNETNLATPVTFFSAAKALELSTKENNEEEVVNLINRAVNCYARPYPIDAAPYIWERAKAQMNAQKYREAVADFNEYYLLMNGKVNDLFYYTRSQAAIACKMNQLALDDIAKAMELAPENVNYPAEKAALHIRFNQIDEAIASCEKALSIDPEYPDCYRMLGFCQIQKGNTEEGCSNFNKAKELGDELVDKLIEKYCK